VSLFLSADHELRSGWKFLLYVAFFLLLSVASGQVLSMVFAQIDSISLQDQLPLLALNAAALFIPAVGAMWLTVRFVDHRPFRTFGVGILPHWRRDLLFGLAVAAGMLAVLVGGCYAFGYVSIHWTGGQAPVGVLLATLGVLLVSALNEELLFRGFPLQLLIDGLGQRAAIIAMSALFALVHMNNPNATILGAVNTLIAGILLSLAYTRTRSLWMPLGIHIGWNAGLGFIFGFPLSGIDLPSLWTTGIAGSETILGGNYGPEGGILGTFIFASAALVVNKHGSHNRIETRPGRNTGGNHRVGAGSP
jgi:membrane protease YdiL (CAAX protease family)